MKVFTVLILAIIIVSVSIIASPTLAYDGPLVGVKEGDWIEYNITVTGTGTPPPTHDVRWMRIADFTDSGCGVLSESNC